MNSLRHFYAEKALSQIPRLLGNMDRNQFSPTYGCFHRDYWLDKTSDFPDAVRQFGVQSLAIVYKEDFPNIQIELALEFINELNPGSFEAL